MKRAAKLLAAVMLLSPLVTTTGLQAFAQETGVQVTQKEISEKVQAINDQISQIDVTKLTLADQATITRLIDSYNQLSETEKAAVQNSSILQQAKAKLDQLTADDAAKTAFEKQVNALPAPNEAGLLTIKKIQSAQAAYEALTKEQQSLISADVMTKLTQLEARATQLQDKQDQSSVASFQSQIKYLKKLFKKLNDSNYEDVQMTLEDTQEAYNNLSANAKTKISADDVAFLAQVEAKINDMIDQGVPAQNVTKEINQLPTLDQLTTEDAEAVSDAKEDYDDLAADQQAKVEPAVVEKLTQALNKIKELQNDAAIKAIINQIEALPAADQLTVKDKAKVDAVQKAYDALNKQQQESVTNEAKLAAATKKVASFSASEIYQAALTSGAERVAQTNQSGAIDEWDALALVRANHSIDPAQQQQSYDALANQIVGAKDRYGNGAPWTDAERQAIGILALGGDLTDIKGFNLLEKLTTSDITGTINNQIYGLIVLSAQKTDLPNRDQQIDKLIQLLLKSQFADGGWALFGSAGDIDITGMTLTALAPYQNRPEVKAATEKAVAFFKKTEDQNGNFFVKTFYASQTNSNSQAQAILGLIGVGEDLTSKDYVKNGKNPIDALVSFQLDNGGFEWLANDNRENGMATQQAVQALAQYEMQQASKGWIYDFTKNPVALIPAVAEKQAAKKVSDLIEALPTSDQLTLKDQAKVSAAKTAFDQLSDSEKALISADDQATLSNINAKLAKLANVSLTVKDVTITVGTKWQAKDNFVSATDENKQAVAFDKVTTSGTEQVQVDKAGTYKVIYQYGGIKQTASVTVVKKAVTPVKTVTMLRLYNPNSGEHFYTADPAEQANLVKKGWNYEGTGWKAPAKGEPVYRLYNKNAGDHHYTKSAAERDFLKKAGWSYEGVAWYSGGSKTVYRLYNKNAKAGSHHYTLSSSERDFLKKAGWSYEGTAWNAE